MRWNIEDLPPRLQEQARAQLAVRSEDEEPYKTPREEKESAAAAVESELQSELERWLVERGYGRRTPKAMQRHSLTRWLVHLANPRGNPILLDILLLWHLPGDPPGHNECLELELKVQGGALSPDQSCLVLRGNGAVAWSLEQAQQAVLLWERTVTERRRYVQTH